jgi:hypothetical protein
MEVRRIEKRKVRVIIGKSGGNSSVGSLSHKISLPNKWVQEMGVTLEDRDVLISFDGHKILIEKR